MKKKTSLPPYSPPTTQPSSLSSSQSTEDEDGGSNAASAAQDVSIISPPARILNRDQVPTLMRTNSGKRIINHRPMNHPTKNFRMKSLLWVKPTVSRSQLSNSITSQLFPALIVNLAAISSGMSLGYSAIALPQLKPYMDHHDKDHVNTTYYRPFTINDEEGSWIASIFGIGAIFGGFASGLIGCRFGRRKTLLMLAIPDVLGWILIAAAQNMPMMLIGRFLCGFTAAGYTPAIQIYIAEIAQPQHRAWLSGITVPTLGLGSLLSYILGASLSWHWVAVVAISFPILVIPGLLFLSDSPYWYFQQGQDKKALSVMERFRHPDANVFAELLAISDSLKRPEDFDDLTYREMFEQMLQRQYRKPFIILNVLFLLMVFSGKFAITFYAVEIFHKASNSINEYYSAIIIGAIKLCGSLLYIPAVRYFSRRTLLCSSSLLMGCSLVLMGLSMFSHTTEDGGLHDAIGSDDLSWLPLLCVTLFMLADPLGLGSIPFLYTAEFYPSEMRSLLGGITIGLCNLEMFLVVKTFPNISHAMGDHATFWLYAGVCFLAVIFTLLFVPETQGKSLQDIEDIFSHKEKKSKKPDTPYVTPSMTPSSVKRGLAPYPHLSLQFTL